jgi:hypothetical protein
MEHTSMAPADRPPAEQAAHDLVQWCASALALPNAMNVLERSGMGVDRHARPTILRLWAQATAIQELLCWRCPAPPERPERPEEFGRAVAALRDWARSIETPKALVWLGDRQYQIGAHPAVTLEQNEHDILQAMLNAPGNTLNKLTLVRLSGYDDASRVLGRLRKKYGGIFVNAIQCPGARGRGGTTSCSSCMTRTPTATTSRARSGRRPSACPTTTSPSSTWG